MYLKHFEFCLYDTEVFPALITKAENPKATFLIFGSGKFYIYTLITLKYYPNLIFLAQEQERIHCSLSTTVGLRLVSFK